MIVRYIINFYERTPARVRIPFRTIIPNHCKACGRYLRRKCHKDFKEGFAKCRNGLFVFCDVAHGLVFWGMAVDGRCEGRYVRCVKGVILASQTFLKSLIRSELKMRRISELVTELSPEMRLADQHINAIQSAFNDVNGSEERIVGVSSASVDKAISSAFKLATLRQRVHQCVSDLVADDFFNIETSRITSALTDKYCLGCSALPCIGGMDEMRIQTCTAEKRFLRLGGVACVGITWSDKQGFLKLRPFGMEMREAFHVSVYAVQRSLFLKSARRFLHDAGQYIAGLQNVLPQHQMRRGQIQMMVADIRTVIALASALRFLKKLFDIALFGQKESKMQYVPLYRMFDRYRYCFADRDTRISLKVEPNQIGFFKEVRCSFGFERIVLNLFGNAVKYMPPQRRCIDVCFLQTGTCVKVSVSSMGPALDDAEIAKLGRHGFRGRLAREGFVGEGMGLSVVREYVERSNMSIKFTQEGSPLVFKGVPYRLFTAVLEIPICLIRDERR